MKVTSLKELDSYIYSSVVLPLKALDVEPLGVSSPILDSRGREAELHVIREETSHRRYDHNFQRNEARERALYLIMLRYENMEYVLADYDRSRHGVNIYAPVFERLSNSRFLFNKLGEAFDNYTPFGKVTIKQSIRGVYQGGSESVDEEDYDD